MKDFLVCFMLVMTFVAGVAFTSLAIYLKFFTANKESLEGLVVAAVLAFVAAIGGTIGYITYLEESRKD